MRNDGREPAKINGDEPYARAGFLVHIARVPNTENGEGGGIVTAVNVASPWAGEIRAVFVKMVCSVGNTELHGGNTVKSMQTPHQKFCEMELHLSRMGRHFDASLKGYRLGKDQAYRAAKQWLELIENHHEELIAALNDKYPGESEPVGRFLEEGWVRPMRAVGEDPDELFKAVKDGMTRQQYLAGTTSSFLASKHRKAVCERASAPIPSDPIEGLDQEEQIRVLREQVRVLRVELGHMKRERDEAIRRMARMEREIKKMGRSIERASV